MARWNVPQKITDNKLIDLYKQMWVIRFFEEKVDEYFAKGMIHGTTHLAIGQEASAVGVCALLGVEDKITSTHRGHGHCIAKGATADKMMAELFGRTTGYCKGKGGSMHIADVDMGNLGANGIVAGGIPLAVGSALTAHMKKLNYVTVCFFGDGATNEGSFHEAVNLASIWKLPVIFVCENNQYGMSSPIKEMVNVEDIAIRSQAYGIPGVVADGNDMIEMMNVTDQAIDRARKGEGPTFIEAKTYRWKGHSKSDKNMIYRTRAEEKEWIQMDPIKRFKNDLMEAGILTGEKAEELQDVAKEEIEAAVKFSEESPMPTLDDLLTDVYA
ncbi:thiamine pyrophosphate-dependent dehydrogenase E1 component subunit alpha [Ornithinibacillus salinisoli]|uniref:Thiamine pyrophosphate-dependent dehydrogenase E1 component subunit alpha n=1 Tax=Ornithinibacillus salinisoli TaxID=1848459 RepID=A0ABW4VZV3_9BACI